MDYSKLFVQLTVLSVFTCIHQKHIYILNNLDQRIKHGISFDISPLGFTETLHS